MAKKDSRGCPDPVVKGAERTVKTFILDTNVIMRKADCIYEFAKRSGNKVVITSGVLEELDHNKSLPGSPGMNCHKLSWELLSLQQRGSLKRGVRTREGGVIQLYDSYRRENNLSPPDFRCDLGEGDLDIIQAARYYQRRHPKEHVVLVSSDKNVIIVATESGVLAEHRKDEEIDPRKLFSGYRLVDNENLMDRIYSNGNGGSPFLRRSDLLSAGLDLASNEFVVFADAKLRDEIRKSHRIPELSRIFRYDLEEELLKPIVYRCQPILGIKPRNLQQVLALDLMLDDNVQVVPIVGEAGTGKTLLALAAALYKTISRRKAMRDGEDWRYGGRMPTVFITKRFKSVLDEDDGYKPGDELDKNIENYEGADSAIEALASLSKDNYELFKGLGGITLYELAKADNPIVTLLPLKKVRGMTSRQIILIEEGQNMEPFAIKTMISRIGERSVFVTGDVTQSDNKGVHGYDGLTHLVNTIHSCRDPRYTPILGTVTLRQNLRSRASEFAAKYL